jgi:serine/threonine protein kinase
MKKGARSSIHLATSKSNSQQYAIKKVGIGSLSHREQIINEIVLSRLSTNKNIIEVYEVYEHSSYLWVVEELMLCSLAEIICSKNCRIEEDVIGYILKEVTSGVNVLHTNHRMHRDIKSENVLVCPQGSIKLADFGSAAQLIEEENLRSSVIGTPDWMAPELALGQSYNEKIDIWSLGILAFQLAEGSTPNSRESPVKALLLTALNPAASLSEPSKWSNKFINFVESCLNKNPELRPSSLDLLFHDFIQNLPKQSKQKFLDLVNGFKRTFESN